MILTYVLERKKKSTKIIKKMPFIVQFYHSTTLSEFEQLNPLTPLLLHYFRKWEFSFGKFQIGFHIYTPSLTTIIC